MLTLSSSNYKKEDYENFKYILDYYLKGIIHCTYKGTMSCSICDFKKPCYDLSYLYDYIKKKL